MEEGGEHKEVTSRTALHQLTYNSRYIRLGGFTPFTLLLYM